MLDEDHHPYTDDISSPVAAHLLDFCDNGGGDLFAAVNATSTSSEDGSSSSTTTHPWACSHGENTSTAAFSPMPSSFESTLSALLEEDEAPVANDVGELLLPIEYQYAAAAAGVEQQMEQFDQLAVAQLPAQHPALHAQMSSTASELMQLASSVYSDDCFSAAMRGAGGFVGLDEALCQPPPGASLLSAAAVVAMQGGCFFGKEMDEIGQYQRMMEGAGCTGMVMPMMGMDEIGEYPRMMEGALVATHAPDAESVAASMPFGGEMQMSGGCMSPGRLPATTTETSSLEDPNFKSARISVEERREKIHRYIKKRNERNFSKKIKYACRKTLADSRPRVRGRFAKNDDYGEPSTAMQSHDEYEQMNGMKGEEDMLDSDVLQAHLSGMNSYTSSHHALESWI